MIGFSIMMCFVSLILMFIGRVGGLTLIFATVAEQRVDSRYPQEKITVG